MTVYYTNTLLLAFGCHIIYIYHRITITPTTTTTINERERTKKKNVTKLLIMSNGNN